MSTAIRKYFHPKTGQLVSQVGDGLDRSSVAFEDVNAAYAIYSREGMAILTRDGNKRLIDALKCAKFDIGKVFEQVDKGDNTYFMQLQEWDAVEDIIKKNKEC